MEWDVLTGLSEGEIEQALATGHRRRFRRREVVWHEGDRADTIHVVRSGRIAIQSTTPFGEVVTVIVLAPGQAAGLVGALGSERYTTTSAVALEPTETLAIRVDDLARIRAQLPAVNEAVIRFLSDRTQSLAKRLAEALYVPAEARVVIRLLALCEVYDQGQEEVVIPLTQEDLAGLAGVTRPTVNRVLKKEERRGTVRVARGSVTVIDRGSLVASAT